MKPYQISKSITLSQYRINKNLHLNLNIEENVDFCKGGGLFCMLNSNLTSSFFSLVLPNLLQDLSRVYLWITPNFLISSQVISPLPLIASWILKVLEVLQTLLNIVYWSLQKF
jgi:hypothetical protein